MTYDVTLTELPSIRVARKRTRVRATDLATVIGQGFDELLAYAARSGGSLTGPPQAAYLGDFTADGEVDVELYLPTDIRATGGSDINVVELPGGTVAQAFHHGRYEDLGTAYNAVSQWIRTKGLQHAGPTREIYLTGPDAVADPAQYLTEIVVPVRQR
jgi:effector-binding domain-containing protein